MRLETTSSPRAFIVVSTRLSSYLALHLAMFIIHGIVEIARADSSTILQAEDKHI